MSCQIEIINSKNSAFIFDESLSFHKVVFKIKKELEYPDFYYKNQYLTDILNSAKNNYFANKWQFTKDFYTWTDLRNNFEKLDDSNMESLIAKTNLISIASFFFKSILTKEVINDLISYIVGKLKDIINVNCIFEKETIDKIKKDKEFINFKKQYKILEPTINVFFNKNNILNMYDLEFQSLSEKYQDVRKGKIKTFAPAGKCFYNNKIVINNDNLEYLKKWGKDWSERGIQIIFLHELGHAIDYSYKKDSKLFLLNNNRKYNQRLSNKKEFEKLTRCAYKATRNYDKKQKRDLNYYISPKINLNEDKSITYKWERAYVENFAESFSFVSLWFIKGLTRCDTFSIESKKSHARVKIKALMRSLIFLLKYVNWEYLGIAPRLLRKRKKEIMQFLAIIDKIPLVISNGRYSEKIKSFKKPILKNLAPRKT